MPEERPAERVDEPVPPFLESDPPHWAARGLAYLLLLLFATAAVGAVAIHVPETVSGPFVLVPVRGTDPIRSARDGVVAEVQVREGQTVRAGSELFVIRSQPVGDRYADLGALATQLAGAEERAANVRRKYDSQRLADDEEARNLTARSAYLNRIIELKEKQHAALQELAERYRQGYEQQTISWLEYQRAEIEAGNLAVELEQARTERDAARAALKELRHEAAARQAEYREIERSLNEEMEKAGLRRRVMESDLFGSSGSLLPVTAACSGTVLRLQVKRPGAVVRVGDMLGEIACSGERLQAELMIPESGMALIRRGQAVKLLYDAFPYQRYGVKYGTVRWITPASVPTEEGVAFRILADVKDLSVRVRGRQRALRPGMGGRAAVVVGRRSLVSHVFEPIRQLKESVAGAPER